MFQPDLLLTWWLSVVDRCDLGGPKINTCCFMAVCDNLFVVIGIESRIPFRVLVPKARFVCPDQKVRRLVQWFLSAWSA